MKIKKGNILIAIGCLLLVWVVGNYSINIYESKKLIKEFKSQLKNNNTSSLNTISENVDNGEVLEEKGESITPKETIAKDHDKEAQIKLEDELIGILSIEKIDLECPIKESTSKNTLKTALGHDTSSVYPGDTGNFVLAGHRSYTYGTFFNRLNEIEIGDKIEVITQEKRFIYSVNDIFVVEPDDISVVANTPDATITLITCTPIYTATHRLIIKGVLVE